MFYHAAVTCCSMVWCTHSSLLSRAVSSLSICRSQAYIPSCLTSDCLDLVYHTSCPCFTLCFSHYDLTIFLSQFLLWSFPVQPLSTRSNLILMTTVSLSNPTLWVLLEGLNTNAEHVGDIRALSPIASMGDSVPSCLGGLISEASIGIKDL